MATSPSHGATSAGEDDAALQTRSFEDATALQARPLSRLCARYYFPPRRCAGEDVVAVRVWSWLNPVEWATVYSGVVARREAGESDEAVAQSEVAAEQGRSAVAARDVLAAFQPILAPRVRIPKRRI
jgi:hypothetical protein